MKTKSNKKKWKVTLYGRGKKGIISKTFKCRTRELCRQLKHVAYDEDGWSGPITKI